MGKSPKSQIARTDFRVLP